MTFQHHKYLTYGSADSRGQRPDKSMIGKSYFHPKTKRIYRVNGFVWNSTLDTWEVRYSRNGCEIEFTRDLKEFTEPRFIQIADDTPGEDYD